MSATSATLETPLRPLAERERVTQSRVIRSEWTKLWSLRSTRWSLLAAFIAMAGLGPLVAAVQMSRWTHLDAHERQGHEEQGAGKDGRPARGPSHSGNVLQ